MKSNATKKKKKFGCILSCVVVFPTINLITKTLKTNVTMNVIGAILII
jgi:hypothetical protein